MAKEEQLTNEQRISALEKAREMSRPERPGGYQAFLNKAATIEKLEDTETIKNFVGSIERLAMSIDKQAQNVDDAKLYSSLSKLVEGLKTNSKEAENNTKNWEKVAKATNKISESLNKAIDDLRLSKNAKDKVTELLNTYEDFLNTSENAFDIMKQKSETLAQTIDNGIASFGQSIMKFSNFLNLNKLVTGGTSTSDLRNMQHGVKVDLGIIESEAEIVAARKYYNDIVTDYNKLVRSFPSNIVAKVSRYKTKTYFDGKNMEDEDINDFKL